MVYECSITQEIVGRLSSGLFIDPKNYLYCEDEEELKDCIRDDIYDCFNYGDLCEKDIEHEEFNIPDKLIIEWKRLKNN